MPARTPLTRRMTGQTFGQGFQVRPAAHDHGRVSTEIGEVCAARHISADRDERRLHCTKYTTVRIYILNSITSRLGLCRGRRFCLESPL